MVYTLRSNNLHYACVSGEERRRRSHLGPIQLDDVSTYLLYIEEDYTHTVYVS